MPFDLELPPVWENPVSQLSETWVVAPASTVRALATSSETAKTEEKNFILVAGYPEPRKI